MTKAGASGWLQHKQLRACCRCPSAPPPHAPRQAGDSRRCQHKRRGACARPGAGARLTPQLAVVAQLPPVLRQHLVALLGRRCRLRAAPLLLHVRLRARQLFCKSRLLQLALQGAVELRRGGISIVNKRNRSRSRARLQPAGALAAVQRAQRGGDAHVLAPLLCCCYRAQPAGPSLGRHLPQLVSAVGGAGRPLSKGCRRPGS